MARRRKRWWWLLAVPVAYALFLVVAAAGCGLDESVFFAPDATVYQSPQEPFESVEFRSADGTKLTGWFLPARVKARGTVVHFHGNSENMTSHYGYVYDLPARGYNVLTFDYRGYGQSEGRPTIAGVVADGLAAIRYVQSRRDVNPDRILVFGQSLGAAVACTVVGRYQPRGVRGVVLDSCFASYPGVVADGLRRTVVLAPLAFKASAISDEYGPAAWVGAIAPRPLLILHGQSDRVVPVDHAMQLMANAGRPNTLQIAKGMGHMAALDQQREIYRPILWKFFAEALAAESEPKPDPGPLDTSLPRSLLEGAGSAHRLRHPPRPARKYSSRFYDLPVEGDVVVYVLDRSGEMVDTFNLVKRDCANSIGMLEPSQSFQVILTGEREPLVPPGGPLAATHASKVAAVGFLKPRLALGKPSPDLAIFAALDILAQPKWAGARKEIFFVSGGTVPGGEQLLAEIKRRHAKCPIPIHTILYPSGKPDPATVSILQRLAAETGGTLTHVSEEP